MTLRDVWNVADRNAIFVALDGKLEKVLDGRGAPVVKGGYGYADREVKCVEAMSLPMHGVVLVATLK